MRKIVFVLAFLAASQGQCSYSDSAFQLQTVEENMGKGFNKIVANLEFLNNTIVGADSKTRQADWFKSELQDLASEIAKDYVEIYGYSLDTVPLKAEPAYIYGSPQLTVLSRYGRINLNVFNENVVNYQRTKGFIYCKAKGFSMTPAVGQKNQYLVKLLMTSMNKTQPEDAVYLGMIDFNSPLNYLDLVGPEGRRLSLNLNIIGEKKLSRWSFVRAFKALLNLRSKGEEAIFESRGYLENEDLTKIDVDPRVPNGIYNFRYEASMISKIRDEVTGKPFKDEETGDYLYVRGKNIASVHGINKVWREILNSRIGSAATIKMDPGFSIHFPAWFDPMDSIQDTWFEVVEPAERMPLYLWSRVDWEKIELFSVIDFGKNHIQKLLTELSAKTNESAVFMAGKQVPEMLKRLAELKHNFFWGRASSTESEVFVPLSNLSTPRSEGTLSQVDATAEFRSHDGVNSPRTFEDLQKEVVLNLKNVAQDLPLAIKKNSDL